MWTLPIRYLSEHLTSHLVNVAKSYIHPEWKALGLGASHRYLAPQEPVGQENHQNAWFASSVKALKKSFVADEVLLLRGIAKLAIICCVLRVSQIRRARGKRGRSGAEQIKPSNLADSDQVGITRQVLVQKNRPCGRFLQSNNPHHPTASTRYWSDGQIIDLWL